jgi:hypothetical protein
MGLVVWWFGDREGGMLRQPAQNVLCVVRGTSSCRVPKVRYVPFAEQDDG